MWATLVRMYKTEGGVSALYRGMIPTVAGVAPYVCPSPGVDARFAFVIMWPLTESHRLDLTSWCTSRPAST